jgi:2-oxoglutarate dehydrogenase complex dehydrogenase (E1) component-like enzyme
MTNVDAVNSGYARGLLEDYLENPAAVPAEWRTLFEGGNGDLIEALPGLARLLETLKVDGNGGQAAPAAAPAERTTAPEPADESLLGGVAAAMSLVKALRMHGHLAARLDPLGSEPVGDPALEPERLEPKLTPELQARIPAQMLRVHAEGETLEDVLPKLQETYTGTSAYEIEHISDHEQRIWLREAIESGRYRA